MLFICHSIFFKNFVSNCSWHSVLFCVVSDVQHSCQTIIYFTNHPLGISDWRHTQLLQYHWLYSPCCTIHSCDYFVTTSLYFSIPSPFAPSPQVPSPPATISPFSASMRLFGSFSYVGFLTVDVAQIFPCWPTALALPSFLTFDLSHSNVCRTQVLRYFTCPPNPECAQLCLNPLMSNAPPSTQ